MSCGGFSGEEIISGTWEICTSQFPSLNLPYHLALAGLCHGAFSLFTSGSWARTASHTSCPNMTTWKYLETFLVITAMILLNIQKCTGQFHSQDPNKQCSRSNVNCAKGKRTYLQVYPELLGPPNSHWPRSFWRFPSICVTVMPLCCYATITMLHPGWDSWCPWAAEEVALVLPSKLLADLLCEWMEQMQPIRAQPMVDCHSPVRTAVRANNKCCWGAKKKWNPRILLARM